MLLTLFFLTTISFSQEDTSTYLKPVSVYAKGDSVSRISIIASPVPHFKLNENQLQSLAVTDIGAAMKYLPGVQLKDYGGIGGIKTISFRSLGASQTVVIVDGIKIPNVQSGAINLSGFELFGVQEAAFSIGQNGNELASASSYLQVNSIRIQSQLASRPEKFRLKLYSNTTSINAFENGILIQTPLQKKGFLGAQYVNKFGEGNYTFTYPQGGFSNVQERQNSRLLNHKIKLAGGYKTKKSHLLLSGNYYWNDQELPGAVVLYNPSNDQKLYNEDYRVAAIYQHQIGHLKIGLNTFYQSNYTRYVDPNFLNLQGFIDSDYKQENICAGLQIERHFFDDTQTIFFGTDYIHSDLESNFFTAQPKRSEINSVFGYRLNYKRWLINAHLTTQFTQDNFNNDATLVTKKYQVLSPFFSAAYLPLKKQIFRLRTFYKRSFSLPTFNDLYYTFIGNTNLLPEDAHVFNLGMTFAKKQKALAFEFTADAFYNLVSNKIVAIPTKDLFNWSMQNIGKSTVQGYDISGLVSLQKKELTLTLNAAYSYNQTLDITNKNSSTYLHQLPYTPFHTSSFGFGVSWKKFIFNVNGLYTGFRYSLNENIYANYIEPFTDITLRLAKKFTLKNESSFLVSIAALNVLNKNYEVVRSFPMPGRYYQFTLHFEV